MKTCLHKIFSGILIAVLISSLAITQAVFATPPQASDPYAPATKHEPKRGINPETGKVSYIGAGEPIRVAGVSDINNIPAQDRAMGIAKIYGKEFGLKNPSQELKLLRSKKDNSGKDIVHFQQTYKGIPVIGGEMIVNMNAEGDLLSISGEVSSDLTLNTNPTVKAQEARKTALTEIEKLHEVNQTQLISSDPELWIFDESLLTASTSPVELVWRMEVTAKDATQPIREMVLINAQTGEVSFHVNQVDTQGAGWPVYFDIELDETRGWIYGSDSTGNKIDVIAMSTLQLVKSFTLVNGAYPKGIALSPDGKELAIAQNGAASILFLNPDTAQTIATLVPNAHLQGRPWDVVYGNSNQLYTSGSLDYLHLINTTTHTEIARSTNRMGSSPNLVISSTNNFLFVNDNSNRLYRFDVSSDNFAASINTDPAPHDFGANTYVLLPDDSKIFTSSNQVWKSDLSLKIGQTTPASDNNGIILGGRPAVLPNHDAIAVAVDNMTGTDILAFVSTDHFFTLSSYTLPNAGTLGDMIANTAGTKLYLSSSNGMIAVDLQPSLPGTPVPLPSAPLLYSDLILDEPRGVLYGSDYHGDKIDVISLATLQVTKSFRFANGTAPQSITLSPDGNELAVAQAESVGLVFLDPDTGETLASIPGRPSDVLYGRTNRMYAINMNGIDVIDTSTHSKIGTAPGGTLYAGYLNLSSDKNTLFANGRDDLYKLDVSTDTLATPTRMTAASQVYSNKSVLLVDDTKIFTDYYQIFSSDFKTQLGSIEPAGTLKRSLAGVPTRDVMAVGVDNDYGNDAVWFVNTENFYTLTKYELPATGIMGAMVASEDGSVLYVNNGSEIIALNLTPTLPGIPAALPSGPLPYNDLLLDEARGVLYGSDLLGNKIDVISMTTLQVLKSFRLVNGARPKGMALNPDGNELAVAQSAASSILFLNPETGETVSRLIPDTPNTIPAPADIIYGRSGRAYLTSSRYIHAIDTTSHTEISKSALDYGMGSYLAMSSDQKYLYTNNIHKFDVSTDTFLNPIKTTSLGFVAINSIVLVDDTKIFTDSRNVWNTDLNTMIGSLSSSGHLANLPGRGAVAVAVDNSFANDAIQFVSTDHFFTVSTYTLPANGTLGPMAATSDGSKLFVNTSTGLSVLDISASLPGTPVPLPSGPLPYFDLIADEGREVFYGVDSAAHKIDVISASTQQVIKTFRLANGATPRGIALSSDGNELAIAQNGLYSILFLDPVSGQPIATIPSLFSGNKPWDLVYGRTGRLYVSGNSYSNIHIIDTLSHSEINRFSNLPTGNSYLAVTSDKKSLFANGSNYFNKFDISTDTPVRTAYSYNLSTDTYLLLADESKIFTSTGKVWSTNLSTQLGSLGVTGKLVEIPNLGLVAVLSTAKPGTITFVKSSDYATTSVSALPSVTSVGASLASSAGDRVFVNTNSGIQTLRIGRTIPSSISVYQGSSQSTQVLKPFPDLLKVKIQNVLGEPMAGITVTFTAPISGASGTFADTQTNTTTAVTDANGIASSSIFTANNQVGSYIVKATIPGLAASADFQMTNMAAVTCTVMTGTGPAGLFLPYKQYNCGRETYAAGTGDFNSDGKRDIALSVRNGNGQSDVLVFMQQSAGNFSQPRIYASGNRSESLVAGDINNDGLDDVITADFDDNKISVFLQREDGTLSNRITYSTDIGPGSMAISDLNHDGLNDIVVSHSNAPSIGVFTQNYNGTLNSMAAYPSVDAGNDDIAIGDVNNDGRNDVVKMNGQGLYDDLLVYLQNDNNTLSPYIGYSLSNCTSFCTGNGIGIGDVTGDDRADIVMSYGGNTTTAKIAVFRQDGNGNLQTNISYSTYDIPDPVEIADVNSDDLLDVVVLHSGWLKAGALLQNSNGNLSGEMLYSIPYKSWYYSQALNISDVNGDSLPDLVIADDNGLVILFRNTTIPPTPTPYVSPTPGPGPSPTPRASATPGPSPTPVPPSSTGNRRTYTATGGGSLPGYFLCDQSQSSCTNGADLDADAAHRYAADTFIFYNTHHGRNSFDNAGSTIISTVNYGVNYRNAFWNHSQVVYGDGMAADDVVAHEITHAVTEYTSGLIYYGQSGAINESFSDVWGEFIDQTNGSGTDSLAVKWLIGEDTPLGVIRSMSNPPSYGHPDKMSSPYYYKGSADNGGVHINSGVNNKAAYLMVEGGTFNGKTITGIGINKTAAVYYEAQVYHLTMGANYNDLYYALLQACQNLIGGTDGITQSNCDQVQAAAEAVEMIPSTTPPTELPTYVYTPSTSTPTNTPYLTPTFTPSKTNIPPTLTSTPTRTPTATATLNQAGIGVWIGGSQTGDHSVENGQALRVNYPAINNGPVKLMSTNMRSIIGSEVVIYKVNGVNTSFSEMMALPASQLDTTYWLPWYNNVDLDTQLRFANVSNSTATVYIYINGVNMPGSPFTLLAGESTRKSFPGVNNGPVRIVSNQTIVAAERVIYKVNGVNTSFSEMMALPASQLDTTYWLPWYNNVDLDTQLRFANVSNSMATVQVFVGGQEIQGSPFTLAPGASTRKSFPGVNNGPVKIVSNQTIVAAERVIYKVNGVNTSFSETMALPSHQLNTTYWLPWYNNVDLDTQLRFANVSDSTATVRVYVSDVEMVGSPFTLAPGASTRKSFPGVNNGPVKIVSTQNIVAAERVIYKINGIPTSFSEMLGLPNNQLNTTHWLPWYNNVDLITQLRFGVP